MRTSTSLDTLSTEYMQQAFSDFYRSFTYVSCLWHTLQNVQHQYHNLCHLVRCLDIQFLLAKVSELNRSIGRIVLGTKEFQGPLLLTWFNFNPSMDK